MTSTIAGSTRGRTSTRALVAMALGVFAAAAVGLYVADNLGLLKDKEIYPDTYTSEKAVGEWHFVKDESGADYIRNRSAPQIDFVKTSLIHGADFLFLNVRKSPTEGQSEYSFTSQQGVDYCSVGADGGCQFTIQSSDRSKSNWRFSLGKDGAFVPVDKPGFEALIERNKTIYVFFDRPNQKQISFRFDLEKRPDF